MKNLQDQGISPIQLAVVMASIIIGFRLLTLPKDVAEATGTADGWLATFLGGAIAVAVGVLATRLSLLFPGKTFFQYSRLIVGKWGGFMINALCLSHFLIYAAFEVRGMGEALRFYLLHETPIEVTIFTMLLLCFYMAIYPVQDLVKINQLFLPLILLVMVLVLLFSIPVIEVDNLRPVLAEGFLPVLKGIPTTAVTYMGFGVALYFVAYLKATDRAELMTVVGIAVPTVLYTLVVFSATAVFTKDNVVDQIFPTAELAKTIELPGAFLERLESVFLTIWILAMFTTICIILWLTSLGLSQTFHKKQIPFLFAMLPIVYVTALLPKDLNQVFELGKIVAWGGVLITMVIPIGLYMIAKFRRMGKKIKT
jgi:spore germination protein